MITAEEARALFDYDPETGVMSWAVTRRGGVRKGDPVGGLINKRIHLGRFREKSDAEKARKMAEEKYGFHPNHGTSRPL